MNSSDRGPSKDFSPALRAELRAAGFSADAENLPRDDLAFRMLCAFNGIAPEQAPKGWGHFPNEATKAAWQRVAEVSAWMPIDTAPAGEEVLLRGFYPNGRGFSDVYHGWKDRGGCGWARWPHTFPPTHWMRAMPLPERPRYEARSCDKCSRIVVGDASVDDCAWRPDCPMMAGRLAEDPAPDAASGMPSNPLPDLLEKKT